MVSRAHHFPNQFSPILTLTLTLTLEKEKRRAGIRTRFLVSGGVQPYHLTVHL